MFSPLYLCSLEYVRRHRGLEVLETADDPALLDYINEASGEFVSAIRRIPVPYFATRALDYDRVRSSRDLRLDADLLELTALTNGDGASISLSDAVLRPANFYPKFAVELKQSSGLIWTYGDSPEEAIALTGWWGYVPHYPQVWRAIGVAVPSGGLAAGTVQLSLPPGQGTRFEVGSYYRTNDEVWRVSAIDGDDLDLVRGELGTTDADHLEAVPIRKLEILSDIRGAVREIAVYKYKSQHRAGGRVTVFDGGTVTVEDMDPSVQKTIDNHVRRELIFVRRK